MSQVYGFVRHSGGLVRLTSAPGKGTSVCLCLPQHEQAEAAAEGVHGPSATAAPEAAEIGRAVLLVDDDTGRQAAAERLREFGYRVLEAADGPAALHLLDGDVRVDMMVTDVRLPNGMNGRQVAEAVRERRPGIPLLFITGYAGTELPPSVAVIGKPFELDTLVRRVGTLLAAARRDLGGSPGA